MDRRRLELRIATVNRRSIPLSYVGPYYCVGRVGFEPTTLRLRGEHSNQAELATPTFTILSKPLIFQWTTEFASAIILTSLALTMPNRHLLCGPLSVTRIASQNTLLQLRPKILIGKSLARNVEHFGASVYVIKL